MISRERGGYIGKERPKVGDGFPESFGMIARAAKISHTYLSGSRSGFSLGFSQNRVGESEGAPVPPGQEEERGRAGALSRILRISGQNLSYGDS